MTTLIPSPHNIPALEYADTLHKLQAAARNLIDIMQVASHLVEANRPIDLTGLDAQIGLVCAKALDLPPEFGQAIRTDLIELLQKADALGASLAMPAGQVSP